jgi:hypothetical protein
VDRSGRAKQDSLVRREIPPAEQSPHPREWRIRDDAALAHDSPVGATEVLMR